MTAFTAEIERTELRVELGKKRKEKIAVIDDCIDMLKKYRDAINEAYNKEYEKI